MKYMSWQQKLKNEISSLLAVTLFFACWLGILLLIKMLILADYNIEFYDFSKAVIGALVLAKVVLVLEHVSLGAWVRARPAWLEVGLRTIMYTLGVALVLLLERVFESRHEYDSFSAALAALYEHADIYHVWANVIALSGALLVFNMLSVIRAHLGEGGLRRLFLQPLP